MSTWGAQQQSQQRAELLGQPRSAPVSAQQQQQQVATSQGQSSAASRAIASLSRAVDHGRVTVEELDAQGEKIEGAIRQMDRIHGVLNTSEITLTELEKSWAFSTPAITLQDGHVLKPTKSGIQRPELAGFLAKRSDIFKKWRRRWMVIEKGKLYYFAEDVDYFNRQPRGVVTLKGAEITEEEAAAPGASSRTNFKFSLRSAAGATYVLDAGEQREYEMWMSALRRAVRYGNSDGADDDYAPIRTAGLAAAPGFLALHSQLLGGARGGGKSSQEQDLSTMESLLGDLKGLGTEMSVQLRRQNEQLDKLGTQVDFAETRTKRNNDYYIMIFAGLGLAVVRYLSP